MTEWISVKDRLPTFNDQVIFYESENAVYTGYLSEYGIFYIKCRYWVGPKCKPTHWMPLPEKPENECPHT